MGPSSLLRIAACSGLIIFSLHIFNSSRTILELNSLLFVIGSISFAVHYYGFVILGKSADAPLLKFFAFILIAWDLISAPLSYAYSGMLPRALIGTWGLLLIGGTLGMAYAIFIRRKYFGALGTLYAGFLVLSIVSGLMSWYSAETVTGAIVYLLGSAFLYVEAKKLE